MSEQTKTEKAKEAMKTGWQKFKSSPITKAAGAAVVVLAAAAGGFAVGTRRANASAQ